MGEEMKQIDQYTALNIEDGQYGIKLMEGWVGKDGDFKLNFCKRSFKKGGEEKTAPVCVKLGDKAKAIEALCWALKELTGNDYAPVDIPF